MTDKPSQGSPHPRTHQKLLRLIPGLIPCTAAALLGLAASRAVPLLAALLVAIVLGIVVGNVRTAPASWQPGVAFASRHLLRAGIVLLGLRVSLTDIAGLGWPLVILVVTIVGVGVVATYLMGRALGSTSEISMLVACGFSICGAAAVAAVDGVIKPAQRSVATAIGMVVLFGTLMIPLVPSLSVALGLSGEQTAIWAGGGTHEVAQVVAIGGIAGGGAVLATAVIVKLARVVMLAPMMIGVAAWQRRRGEGTGERPALVPLFVLGFLAASLLRTLVPLPAAVLSAGELLQNLLLAAAMFGLGLGVTRSALRAVHGRDLFLGFLSTVLVNGLALAGALLLT